MQRITCELNFDNNIKISNDKSKFLWSEDDKNDFLSKLMKQINSNKLDIVKRMAFSLPIKSSNPDHLFLKGDNESASTDSRDFGPINATDVLGVVWLCYWPLKRIQLFLPADAG